MNHFVTLIICAGAFAAFVVYSNGEAKKLERAHSQALAKEFEASEERMRQLQEQLRMANEALAEVRSWTGKQKADAEAQARRDAAINELEKRQHVERLAGDAEARAREIQREHNLPPSIQ